jgi:hypothetical protein
MVWTNLKPVVVLGNVYYVVNLTIDRDNIVLILVDKVAEATANKE